MKCLLLLIMVGICFAGVSQSNLGMKANVQTGVGVQKGKLPNAYGIGGMFETPLKKLKPLKVFAALDLGINGIKNQPYQLDFNGVTTNTDVHYTSYVIQLSTGLKYIARENNAWTPYAAVSVGGVNYYTSMSIEDPDDPDECSPMETKPVSYSLILAGTVETGVRIRVNKKIDKASSFIEAGAGYLVGTKGKYLRLEKKAVHDHGEDSYMVKFRQNSTGEVHAHPLGSKYQTPSSQLIFHIAYVCPL